MPRKGCTRSSYYPHNIHFIWMGATAGGNGKLAIDAARKLAAAIPNEALGTVPILQGFLVVPYWAMVRFGEWDAILADKGPRHDTTFTRGAWRYARAMALTAKDRLGDAERELAELQKLVNDPTLKTQVTFSTNTGIAILRIAPEVVAGEIAARSKDWDSCSAFERAAGTRRGFYRTAEWMRRLVSTGACVLAAGRATSEVCTGDLRRTRDRWALCGLCRLEGAGRTTRQLAEQRFREEWKGRTYFTASR